MNLKEEIIAIIKSADYEPMSVSDFQDALGLSSADSFRDLIKILVELEQTGMVTRTKQDRYQKQQQKTNSGLVRGTLSQNKKGFAFLRPDDQEMEDIFIPPTKINRAMDGDVVLVEVKKSRGDFRKGKFEGEVKAIESHSIKQVVGTFSEARHFGFVVPDDKRIMQDIFVPKGQELGAVEGHKVLVQITQYSDGTNSPEGQISAILGHKNDPGVDILSIIYQHGIEIEFPDDVLKEAENVPETIQSDELKGRRDLRDELTITIDGADAKDLDDAIAVKKLDNGNTELTVSIADVSYYVTEGSALDREAYDRATSVYLVDRVIPMIPHRLSNGICSLNPEVDRLAMSCRMEIDAQGQVVKHEIFESVIHSNARMTYDAVNRIITDKDAATRVQYPEIVPMLDLAQTLSQQLIAMRKKRGEIDFDIKEAKVIVNEEGIPKEVVTRERGEGERLIESFMLIANETVAEHFNQMEVPFIYRIHEQPKSERLRQFFDFITNFGIMVKGTGEDIHPSTLQNIHEEIAGRPEDMVISTMMLRSMQQARYDADNLGHFGLAADYYTHFTSPIRRYPDLIVHRLVRKYLIEKSMDGRAMHEWEEKLPQIAEHTSNRERRAIDAERDTDELKKAEFMIQHIGDEFEGVISSVANFGMFVELPNTIEGMVNMQNMSDDYYRFDERQMALIGERKAKVYRIGDVVKVKVIHVDVDERQIDFQIVGMPIDVSSKRERDPRGKTIQAKTKGTQFEKTDKKKKRKSRKGKNARQRDKSGNTQHKPFYKGKKVKKKARKKKK
ncbi:ribonuclease R [Staphylococcus pseudintermedius]|uniref:ribonuclease R n=1 Tax=Staphylococcus pseudintermedius TaxID=283734 RepID=UPI0001F6BDCC|nr:ribonuclease R [Staphylococcus pseudintermedius]ADV05024.1 3'-to-5' exoribonuclease RNase R [Staphylococcus pseudintermedius HKU10-03]EGQ0323763.1 ribonuclease R [Staphylococcus pseudintermedius]EGQ0382310.1 ribonuclease R [Staphylococcus pseudintermedius]EGQ0391354.1 ribonuclease R [Staphylococcus pseudintermedius]EGQ1288068.1 ribonuclease R [Staphylococcus pseudintermedius]